MVYEVPKQLERYVIAKYEIRGKGNIVVFRPEINSLLSLRIKGILFAIAAFILKTDPKGTVPYINYEIVFSEDITLDELKDAIESITDLKLRYITIFYLSLMEVVAKDVSTTSGWRLHQYSN